MEIADTIPAEARALVAAALAGGRAVLAVYATDFNVERKKDDTPVSQADCDAEAVIVDQLRAAFPDIPIVAEESASDGRIPECGDRFFLVDPLDGTKEFIRRNGEFTVNIGFIEQGVPVGGVVLAPALQRIFVGWRDRAWAGQTDDASTRITGLSPIRTRKSSGRPVAVASRSHVTPETEEMLDAVKAGERRSIGSSLKLCLVAEAEADFYPRMGPTMEWDTAAGDAVLRAAGGAVVTVNGKPLAYGKSSVAGMRPFENPYFLAAGDRDLLALVVPDVAA
jgi:3'(2'),5'-bisphosphate nucleotidase